MNRVPVVSAEGKPLMPTKPSKARKLVRDGQAIGKWDKLNQYYIQLTFTPSGTETQPISCGIDPGKHYGSLGIQSSKATLFTSHIFLPFKIVKQRMKQRSLMRRNRRGRRINRQLPFEQRAHRQCRFSNRKQSKLPPSIRANCQLLLRVVTELAKVYPISSIIYEYVRADVDLTSGRKSARSGKGFSPVMVGQKWILEQLSKLAPVTKKLGWQTSNLRKRLGLAKQNYSKGDMTPTTHAVDAVTLASFAFIDYFPFENSQGRGHCWQGKVNITEAPFFIIRRPPISRRQLHLMVFAKGGKRRKYGGTTTRHGMRKGDLVVAQRKGIEYVGWCSGDTKTQISVSDSNWKRIGQFSKNKTRLIKRNTRLICKPLIGGRRFL
ncbi:MAG: RRXRR domain-containing protein, partial [Xenococcus sp. (in: cyanobacteria)]